MSDEPRPRGPIVYREVVLADLQCIHCGRPLKGERVATRCRSCQTSIRKTVALGLLLDSNPLAHLLLRTAVTLLALGLAGAWVLHRADLAGAERLVPIPLAGWLAQGLGVARGGLAADWAWVGLSVGPVLLALSGWLLSLPDFPTTQERSPYDARWGWRVLAILPAAGPVVLGAGLHWHSRALVHGGAALVAALPLTFDYAWNRALGLARMLRKPALVTHMTWARWAGTAGLMVSTWPGVIHLWTHWPDPTASAWPGLATALTIPLAGRPADAGGHHALLGILLSWPAVLVFLWVLGVLAWFAHLAGRAVHKARVAPDHVLPNQSL